MTPMRCIALTCLLLSLLSPATARVEYEEEIPLGKVLGLDVSVRHDGDGSVVWLSDYNHYGTSLQCCGVLWAITFDEAAQARDLVQTLERHLRETETLNRHQTMRERWDSGRSGARKIFITTTSKGMRATLGFHPIRITARRLRRLERKLEEAFAVLEQSRPAQPPDAASASALAAAPRTETQSATGPSPPVTDGTAPSMHPMRPTASMPMTQAPSTDPWHLQRFLDAQEGVYERALKEVREGRKRSHWMWFVFPQLRGLGQSATARRYGISGRAEAQAYLAHPVLGPRLRQAAQAALAAPGASAREIFGTPDDLKLRSCATLFATASESNSVFEALLDRYFEGLPDGRTLQMLGD